MATITIIQSTPLTAQIVFTDEEVAAIASDAAEHAQLPQTTTPDDPVAFFIRRTEDYIAASVARYRTKIAQTMLDAFTKATPEQQQAALTALAAPASTP